jgi:prevent-host-death family protein
MKSDNLIGMRTVTATEAARNFAAVLDEAEHGETIIVTRGGRRVATIGPASACPGHAVKELLRRHRPDDACAEDLQAIRQLTVERERVWPDA